MSVQKSVTVSYFAVLRELRGKDGEATITSARTASDLYEELRGRHGFPLQQASLRVAVNDDFAPWEQEIRDGDHVTFIPPVAGG